MGLSNRSKSFWYGVILIMVFTALLVIFFFLPIFSQPLTDNPDGVNTAIKSSFFEQIFGVEP